MDSIAEFLTASGDYARMKELRAAGFQTREISAFVAQGRIERVKPGLYRLAGYDESGEYAGLAEVCRAVPDGVICLLSTLNYHGLNTFNPSDVYVDIPHGAKPPRIIYPLIKPFFFRERFYTPAIEHIQNKAGTVY
jgi:predicted transcriptional regulator of viral defense system